MIVTNSDCTFGLHADYPCLRNHYFDVDGHTNSSNVHCSAQLAILHFTVKYEQFNCVIILSNFLWLISGGHLEPWLGWGERTCHDDYHVDFEGTY